MMARVALGHTGRPLVARRPIGVAFGPVTLAAIVRVAVPLLTPAGYRPALLVAGALWALAFGVYLVVYVPILVAPRLDGRGG